ncbi:signal peptide peptidase sppa, 36k type [Heliomicrobium modesticaldum Ice1]|uniref:Signal peptide peptidase sppa, 36k type n=1 Tax=Heliobacterium modesticaldum (strain ATCC 51547 / Ice1) TaxID=498761 RepID=B0TI83_HELMI|nr:signal peptide peptidase SppA [Heliomicrobium modesticaldum]ABZ83503.1 signal peptide peptidase sppa, 36k type [Heliomicrobium modesticaldum Ice1]
MAKRKQWVVGAVLAVVALSVLLILFRPGAHRADGPSAGNTVAVVRLEGMIADAGAGAGAGLLGGESGSGQVLEALRRLQQDKQIKAVVLRINSPGGTSAASQEIGREVDRLRESGKVVVASMGDVAASGGYWVAARADKIVANAATTTGSIGVILDLANLTELYQKIGYRPNVIKSGPYKDIASSAREMTPEERAILQGMVDDIYQQFIDVVAEGRHMPHEQVRALADGRVFTGRQAKELGLVDELGNFYDAVALAGTMAGIRGEPEIREYGRGSALDRLLSGMTSTGLFGQTLSPVRLLDLLQPKNPLP